MRLKRRILAAALCSFLLMGAAKAEAAGIQEPNVQETESTGRGNGQRAVSGEMQEAPKKKGNKEKGWYRYQGKKYYM